MCVLCISPQSDCEVLADFSVWGNASLVAGAWRLGMQTWKNWGSAFCRLLAQTPLLLGTAVDQCKKRSASEFSNQIRIYWIACLWNDLTVWCKWSYWGPKVQNTFQICVFLVLSSHADRSASGSRSRDWQQRWLGSTNANLANSHRAHRSQKQAEWNVPA